MSHFQSRTKNQSAADLDFAYCKYSHHNECHIFDRVTALVTLSLPTLLGDVTVAESDFPNGEFGIYTTSQLKGLFELMTKKNTMLYLEIHGLADGKKTFVMFYKHICGIFYIVIMYYMMQQKSLLFFLHFSPLLPPGIGKWVKNRII